MDNTGGGGVPTVHHPSSSALKMLSVEQLKPHRTSVLTFVAPKLQFWAIMLNCKLTEHVREKVLSLEGDEQVK